MFEREEGSCSTRYGTQIINRDPDAAGHGVNYGFPAPVTSLAYFSFQSSAWRYAGTSDGRLYRRAGILQGPYAQIYSGLSGQPFSSLITACYETSQPYLFIYDEAASIKDSGTGFPVLTGIDPPTRTANVLPYSPLLTLIDNFAEGNSYTTSGFDGSEPWAWASITGIGGTAGAMVTDFPQFLGAAATYEITGGAPSVSQTGVGSSGNGATYSGFPNVAVSSLNTITVTVGPAGTGWNVTIPGGLDAVCFINLSCSIDGGVNYTTVYSNSFTSSQSVTNQTITFSVSGLSNLDQLVLDASVVAQVVSGAGTATVTFDAGNSANAIVAAVPSFGYFGDVCNGILSILSATAPTSVPIVSVVTTDFGADGLYHALTITTTTNHNLPNGATVGVYATTNDLVDGFYPASIESATVLTVPYTSATYLSATGGFLWTVSGGASTCVLSNFYSTPYPTQFSAWGFYAQVPTATTTFPVGCWGGLVDTNSTATVGVTADFDLSQNNQVTDFDLIVLTLQVSAPANIASIALQFDVNNSGYTSSYYTATISPAYYQGSIAGQLSAYESTTNQILADTIGILTGDQPTGSTTAQLSPSNFSTGASAWIAVYIPRGNFLPVGNAGQPSLDWSNITGWQLVIETTAEVVTGDGSSTVSANGLYLQWGYGPSSFAGVGYDWRYTYYNANTGTESSPCVTGDTWVMTSDGPRKAIDLVGVDFKARVQGTDYQTRTGGFFATGVKPVFELQTRSGYSVKATAEHEFLRAVRVTPDVIETEWTALDELRPGDKIVIHNHRDSTTWPGFGDEDDGYLMGALVGDGWFNKHGGHAILATYGKDSGSETIKEELIKILRRKGVSAQFKGGCQVQESWRIDARYTRVLANSFGLFAGRKTITEAVEKCSSNFCRGFLRGFFDADGSITAFPKLSVKLHNTDHSALLAAQRMLLRLGITSSVYKVRDEGLHKFSYKGKIRLHPTKKCYVLLIGGDDVDRFASQVGFVHAKKKARLTESLTDRTRSVRDRFLVVVKSIEPCGEASVFDCTVPKVHFFDANGIAAHNCPEQQFNSQFGYLPSLTPPFYLRQAAQVTVYASTDPQVTHIRFYRRGGEYASNWFLDGQIPNVGIAHGSNIGQVQYKDVIGDASLAQAQPLALDNDPPVTSSLVTPIQTTLAAPTAGPLTGQSYYGTFAPQRITTVDSSAIFVENQIVAVGNADNLELTTVVSTAFSSPGSFQAILRLQHNAGEQVSATSVPRQPCSLAALSNQGGVTQAWLAGDPNNPHYLYFSKPGLPENFSPANYIAVSSPSDPIMLVVNWRGTIVVATTQTWYVIVGGAQPYAQPTGAAHGAASSAYAQVEGRIIFLSQDGEREFSGSDGAYLTLPVEWMFRNAPPSIIVPRVSDYASTTMVQYQNQTYLAFQSASDSVRYRLRYDDQYRRFGYDDVPATAMLWEQQTNALVVGRAISATSYGVVQDWVGDYDDGGWNAAGTALTVTPINLTIQTPYRDLGRPHNPKQWNMLEGDYNTQNQPIQTSLFFKGEEDFSIALPAQNLGAQRSKYQYKITATQSASDPLAAGIEAYSMSIQHQMAVTVAPTLYQENIYAVALADERTSFDTYWQKFGGDMLGILPKNFYFDYTASTQLTVSLYADGSPLPYYVDNFTLIPQTDRVVVRVEGPVRKGRLWRMIVTSAENSSFQLWAPVKCETKPSLQDGSGYEQAQFRVSE